jgi:quercetin dioxygenase-like cupin family protein
MVDVRNAKDIPTVKEHNDTVTTNFLFKMEELREETVGSYMQFIDEFAVEPGVSIEPHRHNSHEFYYVLEGSGLMRVGDAQKEIELRDLVSVPRNVAHTLKAGPDGIRCLAFAASFMEPGEMHTPVELSDLS